MLEHCRPDGLNDRKWWISAAILSILLVSAATADAQWTYTQGDAPVIGAPAPFLSVQAPMTCTGSTQTIPPGAYLKLNTPVTVDVAASNEGTCIAKYSETYINTEYHGIGKIWYWLYPPGVTSPTPLDFNAASWPYSFPLDYDSRSPVYGGTPSKIENGLTQVGAHRFAFQSLNNTTSCVFLPNTSAVIEQSINVVECLPKWRLEGANLDRFPTDGTDITVGYPNSLESVVRPVVDGWNAQLSALGLTSLHFAASPDTGCTPSNSHCISVDVQTNALAPTSCGWRSTLPAPDGVYTYSSQVHLKPGYLSWSLAARIATVAHEFGHLLGLDDQDNSCAVAGSVMHNPVICGDMETAPTASDASAVVKTVYQFGSRTTCS